MSTSRRRMEVVMETVLGVTIQYLLSPSDRASNLSMMAMPSISYNM